ncbi:TonB-dependent receptor plug domain-containing protein [Salmonella enterica subsp. enterica]|nr:TonB-dependent receptor plug domain-containing protein [Salmonella enterica subsp. enterica]
MATPFSTTSYTSRMIEDWQAETVAQVLLADPSVREVSPEAGPTENFNMRGFYLRSEDFAWNGLFGLVSYNRVPTEFLERVEVLKGPGALLYGMAPQGSVGATINLVPKHAGAAPLTRLTVSFASHSNLGAHLDRGRRFGADDTFGIRVNAVKSSGRTALDGQSERWTWAPWRSIITASACGPRWTPTSTTTGSAATSRLRLPLRQRRFRRPPTPRSTPCRAPIPVHATTR